MRFVQDAVKTRDGQIYVAAAAVTLLVTIVLFGSTVRRCLREWAWRDAVAAFHQDDRGARAQLLALKDQSPSDPTAYLLLGAIELESQDGDLQVAERLFDDARGLARLDNTSAIVGLVVTRLRLAEGKTPEARAQDAAAALTLLGEAQDQEHPDVAILRGAIALLRGRLDEARAALAADPELAPTRGGLSSLYWNRCVLGLLGRDGNAFRSMLAAYTLRRWPSVEREADAPPADGDAPPGPPPPPDPRRAAVEEPGRLLTLAYRFALTDPTAQPSTPEAVGQRCDVAGRALTLTFSQQSRQGGRFIPSVQDYPQLLNALGIGYCRVERYEEAAARFFEASRAAGREPLYLLNQAEALRLAATKTEVEQRRNELRGQAADAFTRLATALRGQEGRQATVALAATNAAALLVELGRKRDALNVFRGVVDVHPNEVARTRDLGALLDHNRNRDCVEQYRRAIELQHPDAPRLQQRLVHYRN